MPEQAKRRTLPLSGVLGLRVVNLQGEDLGELTEVMLDAETGSVAYAVLRFTHLLGMRERLFALPWQLLQPDLEGGRAVVDLAKERLTHSAGFDRSHWPDHGDGGFLLPE